MKKQCLSFLAAGVLFFSTPFHVQAQWGIAGENNTAPLTTGGKVGIGIASPLDRLDVNATGENAYIKVGRFSTPTNPFGSAGYKIGNTVVMSISHYAGYGAGSLNIDNGTGMINMTGSHINFGGLPGTGLLTGKYNFNGKVWTHYLVVGNYSNAGAPNPMDLPDGYRMAVDGKIICEEVKIQMSQDWPDYVFSNNYKLKSLNEVEQYIEENKHLPDVPSASEIEKSGLEMGEMSRIQMQKIEELTLYMIELKKQNEQLAKQTEALKKEIEALKSSSR